MKGIWFGHSNQGKMGFCGIVGLAILALPVVLSCAGLMIADRL